jgi:HPr kinase/phosphorylase
MTLLHGTCVEINGKAVLMTGKPGVGKSSLALQLIDRGAVLIADDQTLVKLEEGILMTSPPPSLKGLLEVRGIGICPFPYREQSPLALCVDICEEKGTERLPEPTFIEYHGVKVPCLKLTKNDPLGAIKVELSVGSKNNYDSYVK